MRTRFAATAIAAAATASLLFPAVATAEASGDFTPTGRAAKSGLISVGLTADQRLVGFSTARPGDTWSLGKVSGLRGDTVLVGID
ncbi:hypothetical protein ABT296_36400, partial [Streptomyces sp. NPDC000983]